MAEDGQMNEESMTNLTALLYVASLEMVGEKMLVRCSDEVELIKISHANSMLEDMFCESVDVANFRDEAFMEEAGLDMNEFD
jgi:hypothetical protein